MDNFEKVEKIREKTGVSYSEAKEALEANNYDLLDAIVYLENQGKTQAPEKEFYTVEAERNQNYKKFEETQREYQKRSKRSLKDGTKKLFKAVGKGLAKLFEIDFVITKFGEKRLSMPLIMFLILMFCFFWVCFPLIVIGLFCDYRYSFRGFGAADQDINNICNKVADTADDIKNGFRNED